MEGHNNMASGDQRSSVEAVWDMISALPMPERRSLASRILASLGSDEARPDRSPASNLIGAWCDAEPLDDTAVDALLENEILEKHG